MNKPIITRERLEQLADNNTICKVSWDERLELARIALAAMGSEPVKWINGCNKSVPAALRYLAENPRPIGGESSFNTAHLYQLAREIESMSSVSLYLHAQPATVVQMVPEEPPEHLLPKGNNVDATYRRGAAIQSWKQCRAAMLQAESVIQLRGSGSQGKIPEASDE